MCGESGELHVRGYDPGSQYGWIPGQKYCSGSFPGRGSGN